MIPYFNLVRRVGNWRLGITHDLVREADQPYLERWILWCGFTLRLHKFHKGDDDRAFHDHPWWFVTLPLQSYLEITPAASPGNGQQTDSRVVRRFRPHFRPAKHRHIVQLIKNRPVYTLIVTGPKSQEWGFWDGSRFIHHQHWLENQADRATTLHSQS